MGAASVLGEEAGKLLSTENSFSVQTIVQGEFSVQLGQHCTNLSSNLITTQAALYLNERHQGSYDNYLEHLLDFEGSRCLPEWFGALLLEKDLKTLISEF